MKINGCEVRTIGWIMIKHIPTELLQEMCYSRVVSGHRPGTTYDEFRSALCSVPFKNFIIPHLTVGGSWNKSIYLQQLQQCYCENWRNHASECNHATSLLYHVHAVASRNKWFTSCGTSGKLTLWTSLVVCAVHIF